MLFLNVGSYVVHKKLEELGSGEVVKLDEVGIRIRFASGERLFSEALVTPHLLVTQDAPVFPPSPKRRRTGPSKARKA